MEFEFVVFYNLKELFQINIFETKTKTRTIILLETSFILTASRSAFDLKLTMLREFVDLKYETIVICKNV